MIAVLGKGITGKAVCKFLDRLKLDYQIFDERSSITSEQNFVISNTNPYTHAIFSPSFMGHIWVQNARAANCICMSDLDFASIYWKGSIIGVTGTSGKTTVTRFLVHALQAQGMDAYACGNIGIPPCELLARGINDGILVCEISSFQAATLQYMQLDALIWTNFEADHLDVHATLREYFLAKANLIDRLKPLAPVIIDNSVKLYADEYKVQLPTSLILLQVSNPLIPENSVFSRYPQAYNYSYVFHYWNFQKYELKILQEAAKTFKLAPYTLQPSSCIQGITFWNDSKGTNALSTLAALKSFKAPVLWIGGGKSKGTQLHIFAKTSAPYIRQGFLLGQTAHELSILLNELRIHTTICKNVQEAIFKAFHTAKSGDTILFSPGFSSFDMFENYIHRAHCFEAGLAELEKTILSAI